MLEALPGSVPRPRGSLCVAAPSQVAADPAANDDAAPYIGGAATPDEEEDGEDLIGDGMEADYRPMGALDQYEEDGLDFHEYDDMDFSARQAAEAALDRSS